jgi:hypothetical protein
LLGSQIPAASKAAKFSRDIRFPQTKLQLK